MGIAARLAPVLLAGALALAACSSAKNNQSKTVTVTATSSATRVATVAATATATAGIVQAQAQLCSSLDALSTALQPLKNLGGSTGLIQVLASRDAVKAAWANVVSAAQRVGDLVIGDLQAAIDQLNQTIDAAQASGDLLSKAQSIVDAASAALNALTSLKTATKC